MRVIGRLGAYGALLAIVFLGAWLGAAALVPDDLARSSSVGSEQGDGATREPSAPAGMDEDHEGDPDDDH